MGTVGVPVFTSDRYHIEDGVDHPGSRAQHVVDAIETEWKTPAGKRVPTQKVGPDPEA